MLKVIKGIIVLFLMGFLTACSMEQNKESFRVFDNTQSSLPSKVINSEDGINSLKKLLKEVNWSRKLRPQIKYNFTIKHEKDGQTELINIYNVWFEEDKAIIFDNENYKYGTLNGENVYKLKDLLNIENK